MENSSYLIFSATKAVVETHGTNKAEREVEEDIEPEIVDADDDVVTV